MDHTVEAAWDPEEVAWDQGQQVEDSVPGRVEVVLDPDQQVEDSDPGGAGVVLDPDQQVEDSDQGLVVVASDQGQVDLDLCLSGCHPTCRARCTLRR